MSLFVVVCRCWWCALNDVVCVKFVVDVCSCGSCVALRYAVVIIVLLFVICVLLRCC